MIQCNATRYQDLSGILYKTLLHEFIDEVINYQYSAKVEEEKLWKEEEDKDTDQKKLVAVYTIKKIKVKEIVAYIGTDNSWRSKNLNVQEKRKNEWVYGHYTIMYISGEITSKATRNESNLWAICSGNERYLNSLDDSEGQTISNLQKTISKEYGEKIATYQEM